jgi:glyoxylase-like metal-dependent hydrolase (beta-lactamase superfamily II)/8-oxo-dGTP pyrophosphatase MutT (NUDIX family)
MPNSWAGERPRPEETAIAEAASVVLVRGRAAAAPEVFVVRRSDQLRFFGGYHAFPGGRLAPEDAEVPILCHGCDSRGTAADPRRAAAARELFEETGVLMARRADGSFPSDTHSWQSQRRDLLEDRLRFGPFLAELGLYLDAADFLAAGSLLTPAFSPVRFQTDFFVVPMPPGQQAEVWPGELEAGFWTTPAGLLDTWTRGDALVSPPTVTILGLLRDRPAADLPALLAPGLRALEAGAIPAIYFAPGVQMIPLRTVGLPPSSYTNAYLVGHERLYLFDPGAHESDEQQRLFELVEARVHEGGRLQAVVLTHHHPDHIGAAGAAAARYNVPLLAHPRTAELLRGKVQVDGALNEGDRLELGTAPDGRGPWHLEALHTPGHAGGHLCFYEPHYRLLFAGDMVSMLSSVVIAPPDGDLTLYLASLRRLRSVDCRMLLPGHGSPSVRPGQVIDEALAHRARREEQLLAALASAGPQTVAELVDALYKDLPEGLRGLARLQLLAGLEKLNREGRLKISDCRFQIAD